MNPLVLLCSGLRGELTGSRCKRYAAVTRRFAPGPALVPAQLVPPLPPPRGGQDSAWVSMGCITPDSPDRCESRRSRALISCFAGEGLQAVPRGDAARGAPRAASARGGGDRRV